VDIKTLEKIKLSTVEALTARKKLEKLHDGYIKKWNQGSVTRAATTTYNARAADIMTNIVKPNELKIKELISYWYK
tara:strand:- start:144 stop:371 length:228 start_codon:yes stop_codon:yes gene_type:complete